MQTNKTTWLTELSSSSVTVDVGSTGTQTTACKVQKQNSNREKPCAFVAELTARMAKAPSQLQFPVRCGACQPWRTPAITMLRLLCPPDLSHGRSVAVQNA